ncbi:unnamed protein product [Soboliphyme baturini]|uniref:C2H2-type domain-containing protein n=1 Tax=Soboliphyme baturini TaxID=241478 RepID=A0A183IW33_9BILA|nr:unnamed protein product [Soboliphyme baturini]
MATGTYVDVYSTEDELRSNISHSSLVCTTCSKTFANAPALHLHQVKTHKLLNGSDSDERLLRRIRRSDVDKPVGNGTDTQVRYFCPRSDCKYSAPKGGGRNLSVRSRGDNGDRSWFLSYRVLKQHYQRVHMAKRFTCSKCHYQRFSLLRDKTYHEKHCDPSRLQAVHCNTSAPLASGRPESVAASAASKPVCCIAVAVTTSCPATTINNLGTK